MLIDWPRASEHVWQQWQWQCCQQSQCCPVSGSDRPESPHRSSHLRHNTLCHRSLCPGGSYANYVSGEFGKTLMQNINWFIFVVLPFRSKKGISDLKRPELRMILRYILRTMKVLGMLATIITSAIPLLCEMFRKCIWITQLVSKL